MSDREINASLGKRKCIRGNFSSKLAQNILKGLWS